MTENGVLSEKYKLKEMTTKSYPKRTEKNVMDSDGTVIFTHEKLTGGSLLTQKKAIEHGKPVLHMDLKVVDTEGAVTALLQFVKKNNVEVLNVAGSRASGDERIYGAVFEIVDSILQTERLCFCGNTD